ncbi:MAG: DUF4381 domain-containing protein [Thiocapsa sp.]|jgi:hypothetical protein|nr:DUF4381 domain-containing protein [Thiocapsa sp.]MCG6896841.1 DUF4381 domain-containing protein [Thiocapsa sp.]MCG6984117.1 DUF4381 domain-containing protein [Thiocapsa sp.]
MDPLGQLRDWHPPPPVHWWPPAPGWWVLAGLILLGGVWLVRLWWRRHTAGAPARAALRELAALRSSAQPDSDLRAFVAAISGLLRRLALADFPRDQVAGLTGSAWLDFLDATGGGGGFRHGPGRALVEAGYRAAPDGCQWLDREALADLASTWMRTHRSKPFGWSGGSVIRGGSAPAVGEQGGGRSPRAHSRDRFAAGSARA